MHHAAVTSPTGNLDPMSHRSTTSLPLIVHSTGEWAKRRATLRQGIADRSTEGEANDVLLACGEAVDNAFEHGRSPVSIEVALRDERVLEIVVRDTGKWRVSASAPPRGLGLPIMTALMDNVTIDTTDGTALRLSCRIAAKTEGEQWTESTNPDPPRR
jgi:anti-sigma regulatory factor (Ser/Thr protein kinase)